jgi:putative ABC transport system permease protein
MAGGITGVLHTRVGMSASLAGVLVTTALYSVTLFILGGGNLSLATTDSLVTLAGRTGERLFGLPASYTLLGTPVSGESLVTLAVMGLVAGALTLGVVGLLHTDLGLAMRAAGGNPQMARSVSVDVAGMITLGLGLSNGVIALSGALYAQFQGFANIQMGVGAVITGLATLMIGEALLGRRPVGRSVAGALLGAMVFRLLIALAIRAGLNPNGLKLVTALLVLLVLLLPRLIPLAHRRVMPRSVRSHV